MIRRVQESNKSYKKKKTIFFSAYTSWLTKNRVIFFFYSWKPQRLRHFSIRFYSGGSLACNWVTAKKWSFVGSKSLSLSFARAKIVDYVDRWLMRILCSISKISSNQNQLITANSGYSNILFSKSTEKIYKIGDNLLKIQEFEGLFWI